LVNFDDPAKFMMTDHPRAQHGPFGAAFRYKPLLKIPVAMHAQSTMNEYLRGKETPQPFYHEID